MATSFTPFAYVIGDILIGLAAVCLMLLRGRFMAGAMWPASRYDWTSRVAMLATRVMTDWPKPRAQPTE
ncbi:hypothetical protein [uncultured Sulfitobacter sp.]|uniref:hypothetical protein n=1 Tax=uncultured Sulfitobacter sp. TaxID=191468 RepID=UPI002610CDC3|nr:hypothetical protein [uncultured Sulfitobacter sp.]